MDLFSEIAAVILAGLSFVLAGIGGAAARRYHETRLVLVALGLAAVGAVGALGVLDQFSPRYGADFTIGLGPLLILLLAVALLYAALVHRGPQAPKT